MQLVGTLPEEEIRSLLARNGLNVRVGPYTYCLRSDLELIVKGIVTLYRDFPLVDPHEFSDYEVAMERGGLLSRMRSRANFLFDQQNPFRPFPVGQAYAFLEWGMNWCVSVHANEYLKLHAAVISKGDSAIIMPGIPGAGKSTLCAAMGLSGWRVLSDEHALVPLGTNNVVPLCRPVSLKNESIPLIKNFEPRAVFGPVSEDTHKGTVAHLKADTQPDCHDTTALPARIMLFPYYSKDEQQRLSARPKTQSFVLAAYHSFNYSLLGRAGFESMKALLENVACYDLVYHDLDWALQTVEELQIRTCSQ